MLGEVSNSRAAQNWESSVEGLRPFEASRGSTPYHFSRPVRCAYQRSKRTRSRPLTELSQIEQLRNCSTLPSLMLSS
jgi:hypothetical protein